VWARSEPAVVERHSNATQAFDLNMPKALAQYEVAQTTMLRWMAEASQTMITSTPYFVIGFANPPAPGHRAQDACVRAGRTPMYDQSFAVFCRSYFTQQ
jgi:hypothetical protein